MPQSPIEPANDTCSLPAADYQAMLQRSAAIEVALHAATAGTGQLFRPDAFAGLARAVAASAPGLDLAGLIALGKLGAWICAFDDLVDDGAVDDDELALRVEQYELLAGGHECPELAFDPVASLLREVLDALWSAPLGRTLWPLLTSQLSAACAAMRWERDAVAASRRGETIALDLYLHHGTDSICLAVVATAAAMLIGEAGTVSVIPAFLAAQRHAATAVRIANDLATWSRERAEGFAANALAFAGDDAAGLLAARRDAELGALARGLGRLTAAMPATAAFLDRITGFFVALYRQGDLDDVATAAPQARAVA